MGRSKRSAAPSAPAPAPAPTPEELDASTSAELVDDDPASEPELVDEAAAADAVDAPRPPKAAKTSAPAGRRPPELLERLGEPAPKAGAIVDPKTGRVEVPAPGTFDKARRKPQRP